ncbi:MAG TPA: hemolysin III family protein [Burkholderiales bacterium]|nr:hemolysin III family protein [Burkholderiales bacterium]
MRFIVPKRMQSRNEELLNGISHSVGLIAAILATPFLIVKAVRDGDAAFVVGTSVFCATIVLLYLASTIYHLLPHGKAKRVFHVFDHIAIFVLIAGTYTPFSLGVLKGALGWSLFGITWGIVAIGMVLKSVPGARHPILSTALYLIMGWIIIFAIKPLVTLVPTAGILWLVAGGVSYTAGVVFYALDSRLRYSHFIWHLFVMAGTACHYIAVYRYAT